MKKQLCVLVLGLGAVLVACGQLAHASLAPAPNDIEDSLPQWSADGSRNAFDRTAPSLQHIVTMSSGGSDLFVASFTGHFRGFVPGSGTPPLMLVEDVGQTILTIGGRYSGPRAILHGVDASASPDGRRVAYLRGGTLYVARIDDLPAPGAAPPSPTVELPLATGVAPPSADVVGPAWSPDGTRIAIASGDSLYVVPADGSVPAARIASGDGPSNPSWSHDSATIAFEHRLGSAWSIVLIAPDGTHERNPLAPNATVDSRFPQFAPTSDMLAYISDRQHARGGATTYQYALYVRLENGLSAKLLDDVHPYSPPRWNPTATALAVAAGQECLRWGVYVVPVFAGREHRLSNICRYDGTSGADTIHASPYFDIVNGFGGNDHLFGFWGSDKILGENGNDTIVGDAGNDVLFGGPGDDTIVGGSGNDTIIPGNGRDRIDCGSGIDTVDGAGPLDRISKNCEHVRR